MVGASGRRPDPVPGRAGEDLGEERSELRHPAWLADEACVQRRGPVDQLALEVAGDDDGRGLPVRPAHALEEVEAGAVAETDVDHEPVPGLPAREVLLRGLERLGRPAGAVPIEGAAE